MRMLSLRPLHWRVNMESWNMQMLGKMPRTKMLLIPVLGSSNLQMLMCCRYCLLASIDPKSWYMPMLVLYLATALSCQSNLGLRIMQMQMQGSESLCTRICMGWRGMRMFASALTDLIKKNYYWCQDNIFQFVISDFIYTSWKKNKKKL